MTDWRTSRTRRTRRILSKRVRNWVIILLLKMNGTLSGPLSAIFAQFRVITTFLIYFGSQAPWRVTNVVCSPRSYPRSQDRSVFLRSPGFFFFFFFL